MPVKPKLVQCPRCRYMKAHICSLCSAHPNRVSEEVAAAYALYFDGTHPMERQRVIDFLLTLPVEMVSEYWYLNR